MSPEQKQRQEDFFRGLQDLVERTGITLATSESLGAYGELLMVDATERLGRFTRDPQDSDVISWASVDEPRGTGERS